MDKAINNLIDVNKGKKINYFSYNLNDSPNGMERGENNEENNMNNNQKNNENNQENNSSSVITVSEAEVEKHLQLIDILIELEIVNSLFFIKKFSLLITSKL